MFVLKYTFLGIFFFSLGDNLSNMHLSFCANISFAVDNFELVFEFDVILYTAGNFYILCLSVCSPWFFLNVLLNISTNLSACLLDLGL